MNYDFRNTTPLSKGKSQNCAPRAGFCIIVNSSLFPNYQHAPSWFYFPLLEFISSLDSATIHEMGLAKRIDAGSTNLAAGNPFEYMATVFPKRSLYCYRPAPFKSDS